MPSQPPIPHLLSPYLTHSTHSAQSLTIITSVLAATPNWLVLRYLYSVFSATTEHDQTHQETGSGRKRKRRAKRVVLVSFLREWLFWRGEGKRLGLDLQRFVDGDRLRFVDGLSGLFDAPRQQLPHQQQQPQESIRLVPAMGSGRSIPMRGAAGSPASTRGPPLSSTASTTATPSQAKTPTPTPQQKQLHISNQGIAALNELENDIVSVIRSLPKPTTTNDIGEDDEDGDDVLLILDQPDLILATTPGIDAIDISEWVMGLQLHVHSTIITTSADSPLIHNANPYTANDNDATPLEKNHASFVVGLAHRADMVLQLRTLDTGAAKDVSGVLRMSRGGRYDVSEIRGGKEDEIAEKEVLYFVQRDGGVRVFGRGEV